MRDCVNASRLRRSDTTVHRHVARRVPPARKHTVLPSSIPARVSLAHFEWDQRVSAFLPAKNCEREWCQEAKVPEQRRSPLCLFSLQTGRRREPTSGLEPLTCSLRVIHHALLRFAGVANPAYLGRILCCGLLRVAPYCAPGGIRVVSKVRKFHVAVCMSSGRSRSGSGLRSSRGSRR